MAKANCFYEVKIGPLNFRGSITVEGPTIEAWRGKRFEGSVPLGICSVAYEGAWCLVKYTNERRIPLVSLSEIERKELMSEFGIEASANWLIGTFGRKRLGLDDPFFYSPAFYALCIWVRNHPKFAQRHAEYQDYLQDWHSRALTSPYKTPLRLLV